MLQTADGTPNPSKSPAARHDARDCDPEMEIDGHYNKAGLSVPRTFGREDDRVY